MLQGEARRQGGKNQMLSSRKIAFGFYAFLFILGIIMYLGWSIYFGSWNLFEPQNIGVYSIVIILVGFGLVGMLLYYKD